MKACFKKVFAVLLSVMIIFTLLPQNGYAAEAESEKVVAKLNNRGFKQAVDLGPAATNATMTSAVYGKENGRDVVYATANGGMFNAIDVKDNKILFSAQLGDVVQSWSHSVAPDGTVYIAALGLNNIGELWSYSPSSKTAKKIGVPEASGEQLWSSTVDSAGNVYVGTYSATAAGKIIKYDAASGKFTDLGQIDSECGYVRSLAYYDGYVYAGLGVTGKIYRINVETLEKEEITKNVVDIIGIVLTPEEADVGKTKISKVKFCYDLAVVGDYLFAKFDEGNEYALLFYDMVNQKWLDKKLAKLHDGSPDDYGVFGFTQIPVNNNKAYVIYLRHIEKIDLTTFETRPTGIEFGAAWRGAAFVNLGTEEAPELALSTIKRDGSIYLVKNIEGTPDIRTLPCVVQAAPLTLHNLGKGPDGNLYMTTYPGGPRGAKYDPKAGTFVSYAQGQAEGMIAGSGTDMYFGVYPGALIQKMNTDAITIETIFNLKDTYEQDRPYIMQFADNKLLIGTIPDYQKLGGTLTIYDTLSGDRKTYRNVVQDQSIVGLAYKDGKIYGSTSVRGGLDINPTAEKAKMFVWDVAGETKITEFELTLPDLDKPPMISGLTFGQDGLLWGAVDGYIFAMNPETYQIVKSKNIYPDIKNRGMWRPVHILWGEDGLLYTDVGGKLTVMDPSNLSHVTLIGSGAEIDWIALAKDSGGNENIYFLDNGTTNLKMVPVIEGGEVEQPPVEPGIVSIPIPNSDFEEPVADGKIPGWSSLFGAFTENVSFEVSNEKAYTGNYSLKITDKSQSETVFAQSDLIPVAAGVEYTGSVQLYLEDNMASFFLRYFDDSGKQVGSDKDGVNIIHVRSGYKEWQTVKATVLAPEGAKYARLFVGDSNYFTTNGAYFDDFKLTYVGVAEPQVQNVPVLNSGFEQPAADGGISGWSPTHGFTDNVLIELADRPGSESGKCVKVVDKSATEEIYVQSDMIPVQAGVEYTASVELYLESKQAIGQSRSVLILRFYDETFTQIGIDKDARATVETGQESWQTVKLVKTAPEGAKYVRMLGGVTPLWQTPGAYYDNFKLSYEGDIPESLAPGTLLLNAPVQVGEGTEFDVAVKYFGSEAKNLYAFDALINYDPSRVEFVSAQKAGSYNTETAKMMYNSADPGAVKIVSTLTGMDAVCQEGDVVILKFKALASLGKTNITLSKNSTMISAADSNIEHAVGMDKYVTVDIAGKVYEPEDVNNDGKVTLADVVLVAKSVGVKIDDSNRKMDINLDGKIDISDVGLVMLRYMELEK